MEEQLVPVWINKLNNDDKSKLLIILSGYSSDNISINRIIRMLRCVIVKEEHFKTDYCNSDLLPYDTTASLLILPEESQWTIHIVKAIDIITVNHPDNYVRHYWFEVMRALVHQGVV